MENVTWLDVPGWFDWHALYDEAAMTAPPGSTLVEVGVCFGKSLLYLAQKVKEIGRPGVRVMAVDPWARYDEGWFMWEQREGMPEGERVAYEAVQKHGGLFQAFLHNLYHSGLADIVDVVRLPSVEGAKLFTNRKPHFVFIDAAHDEANVKADLDVWWGTGPEWMAGHDCNRDDEVNYPGVWKAVDAKFGRENWEWVGQTCFVVRRSHIERPR